MKKIVLLLLVLCIVSLTYAAATSEVLFGDSYDRPDNTDIDASSAGMSGTLSPLTYDEAFEGSGQASSIQILSNELDIAVGAGMSSFYLEYNFTDAAITDTDGFSVSLDVMSITSADDQLNRFGGFGVGNTLAEAQAAADCYDSSAASFRPAVHLAGAAVSDFYIDLALDQNLRLWDNGVLLNTIAVGAVSGTITVDFLVSDFTAGSQVTAIVYFNGVLQDVQTFAWDNDNSNYIGFSGRTAGAGVFLDNLEISTIYNDLPELVAPAQPPSVIDPSSGTTDLQWVKGKDGTGAANPDVNKYYVYVTEDLIDGDPNFAASTADFYTVNDPTTSQTIGIGYDQIKYWRVDQSVEVDGNDSGPNDPNTITGRIWQFETAKSLPVIAEEGDPVSLLRYPYTDASYEGDAVFTCIFSSINAVDVKWYAASDPNNAIVTGGDFVVTDPANNGIGTDVTAILTISNIVAGYEDTYYCEFELQSNPGVIVEASESADLGVRRQVAYWTLDETDLVAGYYQDISGEGHHAEPNIVPGSTSFVDGVDPAETIDALDLTVQPLAAADSGEWIPSLYTGEITISTWLNWTGSNGNWQGVLSSRTSAPPANNNFYVEIRQDNGNLQIGGIPDVGDLQIDPLPTGEWVHLAITAKAGEVVIYLNGENMAANTSGQAVEQYLVKLYVGALGRNATSGEVINTFNGQMDDIQLYNYAMTAEEVVDNFYNDILEESVCLYPDDTYDVANAATGLVSGDEGFVGDCLVNLSDFAEFASHWLYCGLYPDCP